MSPTPGNVRKRQFRTTTIRPGYDIEDVDAFLDRLGHVLESLTADNIALRETLDRVGRGALRPDHIPPPVRDLTPDDIRRLVFKTVRLRPGYDEREVDAALDDAQVVIGVLIQENDQLRAALSPGHRTQLAPPAARGRYRHQLHVSAETWGAGSGPPAKPASEGRSHTSLKISLSG